MKEYIKEFLSKCTWHKMSEGIYYFSVTNDIFKWYESVTNSDFLTDYEKLSIEERNELQKFFIDKYDEEHKDCEEDDFGYLYFDYLNTLSSLADKYPKNIDISKEENNKLMVLENNNIDTNITDNTNKVRKDITHIYPDINSEQYVNIFEGNIVIRLSTHVRINRNDKWYLIPCIKRTTISNNVVHDIIKYTTLVTLLMTDFVSYVYNIQLYYPINNTVNNAFEILDDNQCSEEYRVCPFIKNK